MAVPPLSRLIPATCLEEIHLTLALAPLRTPEEIKAFYRDELNEVRGGDRTKRLKLGLGRAFKEKQFYKACVMGHQGVGKSTELTRLIHDPKVQASFCPIRFSVMTDLDPGSFNPPDVLLFMMVEVAEQTAATLESGGAGRRPSAKTLQAIWDWFSKETVSREQVQEFGLEMEAGAGVESDSLWNKVLGLFASLKSELRFASTRTKTLVEYRLTQINTLIDLVNCLLDECNRYLQETQGRRWLFIGEDFDKAGISPDAIEKLFISYSNLFSELNTDLIFNLPIGLYNSSSGVRLAFPHDRSLVLPDTPVFDPQHQPNREGRQAVQAVLGARVNPDLFEAGQMERLIVASGGNLRDLFALVNYAADTAILSQSSNGKINLDHANSAIRNLRTEYERRLGQNPFDQDQTSYEEKAKLLKRIYDQDKDAQIPTPVLYTLLNDRAVQEFNGDRWNQDSWFGVHPLVVDLLNAQGRIQPTATGEVPGGTA
jgi:hypothetical protein